MPMPKNFQQLYSKYSSLNSTEKIIFLTLATFNLTLEFRGLLNARSAEVLTISIGLNEIQHKLTSHAISKLTNLDGYPEDIFFEILAEISEKQNVIQHTIASLTDAIDKVAKN